VARRRESGAGQKLLLVIARCRPGVTAKALERTAEAIGENIASGRRFKDPCGCACRLSSVSQFEFSMGSDYLFAPTPNARFVDGSPSGAPDNANISKVFVVADLSVWKGDFAGCKLNPRG